MSLANILLELHDFCGRSMKNNIWSQISQKSRVKNGENINNSKSCRADSAKPRRNMYRIFLVIILIPQWNARSLMDNSCQECNVMEIRKKIISGCNLCPVILA